MYPTLASLVQHPALKLAVLAAEDHLDAEVRWAHASELDDPAPFLDGGELLLTTALKLEVDDPAAMDAYVARLRDAGVVGLGFGVGVHHPEIPTALLDACSRAGLPLLEVERRIPFIAIAKAVSAAITTEEYKAVAAGFAAQRELTRAALSPAGTHGLLERLAAQVDGWAALYDLSGAVTHAVPTWAERRAATLAEDVRRLRDRPGPATVVVGCTPDGADEAHADDRVELQSVGTGAVPRAVLAIGTAAPPDTVARYAVQSAVTVLTLLTERSKAFEEAERRLGSAVLHLLLSGEPEHARAVGGQVYGALLDAPLRVLVAETGDRYVSAFATAAEAAAARAAEPLLLVPDGAQTVLLVVEGGGVLEAAQSYARRAGAQPSGEVAVVIGASGPAGPTSVDTAYQQARQALLVARRRGRPYVEHDDVAAGSVLPLLADDAVRAFADGMLRPLRDHDAHGRGDLVASLRAWLSRHGQWDAAAADLGVHRHTLRYRMRRVEEILERSLDDPDARMELWLALKATDPATRNP
ncbi:PucR family transcriptional regulator [Streptomyces lonarensis]|uniref:PucR family transcriptional regulator n=1 Tax=Streptomyces lonarensis TaxID=700599 RepID=A0A7X6HY69_9ACTN|nr:PucR family transcriptional regulator ligand-binding domain-containing protein [Streptomyces lonarensis]NJQ05311.1 PucR family transcriptional regulator [Streptomyces lonarensis]